MPDGRKRTGRISAFEEARFFADEERKSALLKSAQRYTLLVSVSLVAWAIYGAAVVGLMLWHQHTVPLAVTLFLTIPLLAMFGVIGTAVHQTFRSQREENEEEEKRLVLAHFPRSGPGDS